MMAYGKNMKAGLKNTGSITRSLGLGQLILAKNLNKCILHMIQSLSYAMMTAWYNIVILLVIISLWLLYVVWCKNVNYLSFVNAYIVEHVYKLTILWLILISFKKSNFNSVYSLKYQIYTFP